MAVIGTKLRVTVIIGMVSDEWGVVVVFGAMMVMRVLVTA